MLLPAPLRPTRAVMVPRCRLKDTLSRTAQHAGSARALHGPAPLPGPAAHGAVLRRCCNGMACVQTHRMACHHASNRSPSLAAATEGLSNLMALIGGPLPGCPRGSRADLACRAGGGRRRRRRAAPGGRPWQPRWQQAQRGARRARPAWAACPWRLPPTRRPGGGGHPWTRLWAAA